MFPQVSCRPGEQRAITVDDQSHFVWELFSSYCKATKIPWHHLYWDFLGLPTFLLAPHAIVSSQCELIKASLLKVVFCAEPHPLHLSVRAFCPLALCFFTCWSLHIFSSLVAPAFCGKGGRSRRAATANSISLTGWGDEQSKYLYSEGWDLSLSPMTVGLAGEDKNLASLMKENKREKNRTTCLDFTENARSIT